MDYLHPVYQDMIKLGCSNHTKILLAFQTYMELCEVHVLKEVQYHYLSELDLIYLSAAVKGKTTYYLPVSVEDSVTPSWIDTVFDKIGNPEFTLVIRERDSSAVHYKITQGLVPLSSPEETKKKKSEEEKKQYLQKELYRKKSEIYSRAKQHAEES